jgi:tetratricopeptide (TPR) repeat protein
LQRIKALANEANQTHDLEALLGEAEAFCNEGKNEASEKILNQLVLRGFKRPLVFHLLGTIYYDQGKFNKAIRAFKRALEIDPAFTDSSVGLSIILNDLGRYDEGKKVFEEAKAMLSLKNREDDTTVNLKLSEKHDALGDLYYQYERFSEATREFETALKLTPSKVAVQLKIAECFLRLDNFEESVNILLNIIESDPRNNTARLRLGKIYYDSHRITKAIEAWEEVMEYDADNVQAKDYLRLAGSMENVIEQDLEMETKEWP